MLSISEWLKIWIYLGCILGWSLGARPQFDTSTNMGLVLVPADAEVDSVIFRLRATDQDADFPLIFDITAAVQPIVRVENLPCTLYNKVCQANVILTRRLVPGRLHDFAVRVRDSKGDSNSMQATISVTNATTPRDMIFPHVPSIIMVPEDTKPGKELDYLLVRANPWHGKPVYIELWQPKELFTIRQRQTPTQTRGVITLVGELDFETQSMYTLTMYATDPYTEAGKDTRNIAGVHVVVIVQDVQDVPPVFTLAPPLTRVNNSVKPGDVVLRVHAEDGDKGTPREVTYGLVSEGNPFTPFFNISESTGEIILARPLEELTQITHVGAPILLTVVAEEVRRSREEPPGQATVVELGLLLGEPGNSPPYFESSSYVAWMDENAAPGTVVMFDKPDLARVRDEDIGKTGVFALKLGNNNGTFEVTPSVAERVADFAVTVRDNSLMDYEVRKTLQFTIIAQEVGPATNLSASVPVTIFLRDVNDNPPEFEKEAYEVTIAENVPPGTRVVQVHASDKDTGLSGNVRYTRIIGEGSETLTMDSETGLIIVAKGSTGLDREVTASLQLLVEARDENGRGLSSTVPLIVNLLDVNDNAPIFEKSIYEFVLNSDQTNFTSPAFIKAIDADAEPPNNEVRYELVHGNYGNKFHLNEVTGELILREPLNKSRKRRNNPYVNFATRFRSDFLQTLNTFQKIRVSTEKPLRIWKNRKKRAVEDALYTLTVRAYDSGVPHRSSTAKVQIVAAAPVGALTLMLVVPAEHLDPVRTTETLAAITGGRVTIQEIRPYDQPGRPGEGTPQSGRMSIIVARVEPTMSGTFLVDVETIHKSLVANGMGIVPVVSPNPNSATEPPVKVTIVNTVGSSGGVTPNGKPNGNGNVGGSNGGINGNNGEKPIGGNGNGVNSGPGSDGNGGKENMAGSTSGGSAGKPPIGNTNDQTPDDGTGGGSVDNSGGNTSGGTNAGVGGGGTSGTSEQNTGGSSGGIDAGTAESRDELNTVGTAGGTLVNGGGNIGNGQDPGRGSLGGVTLGNNHQTGVNVEGNFNKINKTTSSSENEYIVYKAENKLLLWLLILLGLLMLLGLLALILCCICPGCPFYMAPRKRRVHSFESVNHPDSRPKRHLRRKQLNLVKADWSGKKQAWSADPMRRNWQFNRRNTKNRGLASLPGDVARIERSQELPRGPTLRLRDGPEPWSVEYGTQRRTDDRIYVEDVEAGRTYDTEDVDSLRRHELERGSDVLRQSYRQTDETSRLPREQHFYRDGNAEVLRLVTGGQIQGEDVSLQEQRPTTLVGDQQALGYRGDGKDILLRRFIEDQNIRQQQDLHGSVQEISVDPLDSRRQGGEQFLPKHGVVILPHSLELDQRHRRHEREPGVERLIIDHGDIDNEDELGMRQQQEEDLRQQRKIAAAMLVGTAVSKATEKPMANLRTVTVEQNASSRNIPTYAVHDVELAKQNALLTQLLMDRDARHLGVPGLDPGSYLETQSLPGQVAIATQTDRTAATQTENRSRSDNEESEEEIRSRRKSKLKKRFGSEIKRSRGLLMRSPIHEEGRSFSDTRNGLLRRKAKEGREGRRATLEPDVLREISDSLDEHTSTPSMEEGQSVDRQLGGKKNNEYRSEERVTEADEEQVTEVANSSSPEISRDKYHRRSHAKAVIGEAMIAQKLESNTKRQSSPGRSKTKSQKNDTKSAEAKKAGSTNGEKKEGDENNSKKRSTESQSNNSGVDSKKDTESKKKREGRLVSKVGLLKSASEKSLKKSKSQETEEAPIIKKRTMLRHQKAKKMSTESSEFEEVPAKPRLQSSRAKPSKQSESTSGSNLKQDTAKSKETSTLSDEPKSRGSETDRERVSQRSKKQSDSNSSSGSTKKKSTKNDDTAPTKSEIKTTKEHVEYEKQISGDSAPEKNLPKTPTVQEQIREPTSTMVISENSKNHEGEIEIEQIQAQRLPTKAVPDKPVGLPKLESEVLKLGTALMKDQLKPKTVADDETIGEGFEKLDEESSRVETELPKSSENSLTKEEIAKSNSEKLLEAGSKILEKPEIFEDSKSKENISSIEKDLETGTAEIIKTDKDVEDNLGASIPPIRVSAVLENDQTKLSGKQKPETSIEETVRADKIIIGDLKKGEPDASVSNTEISSVEKASESSVTEVEPTSQETVDKHEEISPKLDPRGIEAIKNTNAIEKQPELGIKDVTVAFLQSEAMQSSHDSQRASSLEEKSHLAANSTAEKVVQAEILKEDTSDGTKPVAEKISEVTTGSTAASIGKIDTDIPGTGLGEDIKSPIENTHEQTDSFTIIEEPDQTQHTTRPVVSRPEGEKSTDKIGIKSNSPQTESEKELPNDDVENEREHPKMTEGANAGTSSTSPVKSSQRSSHKSPTPEYKSIDKSKIGEVSVAKDEEKTTAADNHDPLVKEDGKLKDTDKNSQERKSKNKSEEDSFPKTESPSFYILSSTSSTEDSIPDREISKTQTDSGEILSDKAVNLIPNVFKSSTIAETEQRQSGKQRPYDTQDKIIASQTHSKPLDQVDTRSGDWDRQKIQIGDISSDSPDNAQPYQTPRHRSRNRSGNGNETANIGAPERTSQLFKEERDAPQRHRLTLQPDQSPGLVKIFGGTEPSDEKLGTTTSIMEDAELTPRLIAEEAIRSGLQEIIDSEGSKKSNSSQTSSKTYPENQNQRADPSRRRHAKETSRIPLTVEKKKSAVEKTANVSQPRKNIEETREAVRSVRPKTEPKGGNPREGDTHQVRPRTQRGKDIDSRAVKPQEISHRETRHEGTIRHLKPSEKTRQVKENSDEIKPQDLSEPKEVEGAIPKDGYMSRYKQKREEMERKRRELKEAAEESQRPRWQKKPVVIPPQRAVGRDKDSSKKDEPNDGKTPEGRTPRTRRRIRPLANAESEQLRAMVKEGRKLRRAEGGDSDDPTVEIFATEPPAKIATSFQPAIQKGSYMYEKIPPPFYLHPPPPPQSTPQVSPLHVAPQEPRRPDDDLDSGIAVSLQGGTKLRHQQLLEKKSVFDIAYSDAAPSQLRTDSTTPPS